MASHLRRPLSGFATHELRLLLSRGPRGIAADPIPDTLLVRLTGLRRQ